MCSCRCSSGHQESGRRESRAEPVEPVGGCEPEELLCLCAGVAGCMHQAWSPLKGTGRGGAGGYAEQSGQRGWLSMLPGLVLSFVLASRLVLPCASELKHVGPWRLPSLEGYRPGQSVSQPGGACGDAHGVQLKPQGSASEGVLRDRNFLFVGVMTAQKYLQTRTMATYRTWSKTIPEKVEFFSSEGSNTSIPIPIVPLRGVDDSYPPQKKSFMMFKYMHDHYLDKYEWFMRADDDVYIKGDHLESFLRSLNSSEPLFLGQTGLGTTEEMGKLALEPRENFCMGGPGVILSQEVLRRVAPYIGKCLREMYTTHEDVEVRRCVRRFAGVQCVWSYEMQQLFYENYEQNKKEYIRDLHSSKIHRAITLHPNKNPPYQYRLHTYILSRKIAELHHRKSSPTLGANYRGTNPPRNIC
ncbi:chondroitin sulfate synthase 1 [Sigmodon hispidus]